MKDIKRDAYSDLLDCKENDNDFILLVEGARQVGKTYLVTKFAKENFKNIIYIKLTDNTGHKFINLLNSYNDIDDEKEFLLKALMHYNSNFEDNSDTVVIIDEIQESADVYNKIRSFNRLFNCRFIIIGSYLGRVTMAKEFWHSAGDMTRIIINTLSFKEFLGAIDDDLLKLFCSIDLYGTSPSQDYEKLKKYFEYYCIIGGFPKVVTRFLENKNYKDCFKIYEELIKIFAEESAAYLENKEYAELIINAFNYFGVILLKEKKGLTNNNLGEEMINVKKQIVFCFRKCKFR